MSNNQTLTNVDRNELFDSIRKQDVNALREFIYHTSTDIIDAINYWKAKRKEPEVAKDKQQRDLISLEIIRLESLMLGRTEFTFSFFKIADDGIIQQNAEIISKDMFKTIEPGGEIVDLLENIADKGGKTIDMFPDKIKLSDLRDRCKALLIAGKGEDAMELATRYLSVGKYYPDKGNKFKAEKMHTARIQSWILDLTKSINKKKESDSKVISPEAVKDAVKKDVTVPTPPAEKSQDVKAGAGQETVENANSIKKESEVAKKKIEDESIAREGSVEIFIKDKTAFMAWMDDTGRKLEDMFEAELIADDKLFKEFDSISVTTKDVDALIKELTEIYHVEAKEAVNEVDDSEEINFENDSMSLDEEITHIEKFLGQLHKLRGTDIKKSENLDEIKDLIKSFFETREDEDYEEQDKVFEIVRDHPDYLKDAKSFFNLISYPKPTVLTAKDSEGKSTPDNYNAVIVEIEAGLKAVANKKEKEREKELAKLEDKWVTQLRGQILAGKEVREDKSIYMANKKTFYTQYHVYHFIDQIAEGKITSKVAEPVTSSEIKNDVTSQKEKKTDVSIGPKLGASDGQTKKEDKKNASEETKPKVHVCESIEEALALVVKNGGKEEDAYLHPFCVTLKGTTIKDPTGVFSMILDEVNYKNYINKKYDEALAIYKANLTEYPMEDMAILVSQAVVAKQTPENFVKENLPLIQKEDGSFLKITGKLGDVDSTANVTSEETFLSWVKEMFELEEKIGINDEPEKVYEISSTIKSFKDFEDQIKNKVTKEKVTLENLKKWAREVALDKTFGEDNHKTPYWFSDKDKVGYLDSYIESLTRELYETPESKLKQENDLKGYIIAKLKTTDQIFYGFLQETKKYCTEKKYDYNLKSLQAIILSLAETHNKKMFETYKRLSSDTKDSGLSSKDDNVKSDTNKVVDTPAKEEAEEIKDTNKLVAVIFKQTQGITSKFDLIKVIQKYKYDPSAVLRAAIHLIIGQKQIKDLKLATTGEVNTWVTEVITGKKEEKVPIESSASSNDSLFRAIGLTNDKRSFRICLDDIVEQQDEDSSEFRDKLITAITSGEGSHTKIVAKQSLEEMHKMIKKAFERKEDNALQE